MHYGGFWGIKGARYTLSGLLCLPLRSTIWPWNISTHHGGLPEGNGPLARVFRGHGRHAKGLPSPCHAREGGRGSGRSIARDRCVFQCSVHGAMLTAKETL